MHSCSPYVFVKEFSLAGNGDCFVSDGVCVNSTPYGAHFTRPTHAIFLVCTWLKMFELGCTFVFLDSRSISSMFHRTLLDAQLSSPFSTPFPTLAPSPTTSLSLLYPSTSPSAATLQGGLCFGRLAEQSPLAGYEPKSLIEVSCEHTPINLPSGKDSLDQTFDDLSTTVDASEVYDRLDMGRLTSPQFSQEREVSAIPLGVSGCQTHSSVGRPMRDTDLFSCVGRPVRDVEVFSSFEGPLLKM